MNKGIEMDDAYSGQIIPVEENFFMTYFKACGAMWQVAYNKMWPAGEKGTASKQIDGKHYINEVEATDARGAQVEAGDNAKGVRFKITSKDGNARDAAQLEKELSQRLREIQEKNLEYYVPKPADFEA